MENDKKYFEDKFKDFESVPSLGVWNDIESGLDKKAGNRKAIFFMRIAAGLALLITALWFTWSSMNIGENKLSQDDETPKFEEVEKNLNSEKKQIAAVNSDNQKKLIPIQNNETLKTKSESEKTEIESKNNDSTVKNDTYLDSIQELVKELKDKEKDTIEINKNDKLDYKPLLAENKADSILPEVISINEDYLAHAETKEAEEVKVSDSKSITIILRPKAKDESLASNDDSKDVKGGFKKFRKTINTDLYKYKIRLGEVPDLALNKLKLRSN